MTNFSNASLYEQAIRSQRRLYVRYDGFDRIIEPHAFGRCRNGNELLRAWQISGGSRSGLSTGWKLFSVDEINAAQLTDDTFPIPRPQYKRGDKAMRAIYAQV